MSISRYVEITKKNIKKNLKKYSLSLRTPSWRRRLSLFPLDCSGLFKRFLGDKYDVFFDFKVRWVQDSSAERSLSDSGKVVSYPPLFIDKSQRKIKQLIYCPSVALYRFFSAAIHPNSSNIISHGICFLDRYLDFDSTKADYSGFIVFAHDNSFASVVMSKKKHLNSIQSGIFLGGNGSWNYYHFLFEMITKILYLPKLNNLPNIIPLLIPETWVSVGSMSKILSTALSLAGSNRDILVLREDRSYYVRDLYTISPPCHTLFNLSSESQSCPSQCYFREESIEFLKKIGGSMLSESREHSCFKKSKFKYLFLSRGNIGVRKYNEDAVIDKIREVLEIEVVDLRKMGIEDQVLLFKDAKVIIGPSGASWSNLVFCQGNTFAFSWLPRGKVENFSCYSTLAKLVDVDMHFVHCNQITDDFHSDYVVDPNKVGDMIIKVLASKMPECILAKPVSRNVVKNQV
nr:glycosyltransferase family 61 protein [uncultured Dethiosulfovibrio sp.]